MAPSPKKQTTTLRSPLELERVRGADRDGEPGRHHAVRAQHADAEIGDVDRAALAVASPGGAAEELGHHGGRGGPLGDSVAVTAMRRRDQVFAREIGADPGGDRLLADREVDGTRDLAGLVRRLGGFLEGADAAHRAVVREQALDIDVGPRHHRSIPHVTRFRAIYSIAL